MLFTTRRKVHSCPETNSFARCRACCLAMLFASIVFPGQKNRWRHPAFLPAGEEALLPRGLVVPRPGHEKVLTQRKAPGPNLWVRPFLSVRQCKMALKHTLCVCRRSSANYRARLCPCHDQVNQIHVDRGFGWRGLADAWNNYDNHLTGKVSQLTMMRV